MTVTKVFYYSSVGIGRGSSAVAGVRIESLDSAGVYPRENGGGNDTQQAVLEIVTVRFYSGETALLGYEVAVVVVGVGDGLT